MPVCAHVHRDKKTRYCKVTSGARVGKEARPLNTPPQHNNSWTLHPCPSICTTLGDDAEISTVPAIPRPVQIPTLHHPRIRHLRLSGECRPSVTSPPQSIDLTEGDENSSPRTPYYHERYPPYPFHGLYLPNHRAAPLAQTKRHR
jgi:hypothetical protein